MSTNEPVRIDRRLAIKWIMAAGAGTALLPGRALWADDRAPSPAPAGGGYGTDPDLMKAYKPGDYWPLTFTAAQRQAAVALCDIVMPADAASPAASSVGIPDFVDEWISAPYPDSVRDRKTIVEGLGWLDAESGRRHGARFADLAPEAREALCAEIAVTGPGHPKAGTPPHFFRRFRDLVAVGYFTTPAGMAAIGYVGNVPLAKFDGPPAEVVAKLGLSDEVRW